MAHGRFVLSASDRWMAGVCGGLAHRFELDPLLVRMGMIVLAFFTLGLAMLLYVVLWIAGTRRPAALPSGPPAT